MPLLMRIIFVLFGVGAIAVSLWLRHMNSRAQSWLNTRARILSSAVVSDPHDSERSVEISYQFTVGAREFTSRCVSFSPLRNDPKSQGQLIAQFPAGGLVEAFYDPSNPERSVLIRGDSRSWLWGPVVGIVFIAIATLAPSGRE
jgi:hypothetical protein